MRQEVKWLTHSHPWSVWQHFVLFSLASEAVLQLSDKKYTVWKNTTLVFNHCLPQNPFPILYGLNRKRDSMWPYLRQEVTYELSNLVIWEEAAGPSNVKWFSFFYLPFLCCILLICACSRKGNWSPETLGKSRSMRGADSSVWCVTLWGWMLSCSQSRHLLAWSVLCKYCTEKAESSTVAYCLKLVVSAV